jgi:hypothetical protein
MENALASGRFDVLCYDKDGNLKWEEHNPNKIVSSGLQYMAGAGLTSTTPITTWYIGLIDGATAPTYVAGDLIGSHGGWTEFQNYSTPATRGAPTFTAATLATPSVVTNATAVSFIISSSGGTVAGAFLVGGTGSSSKGGTTGTLFSESNFTGGNRIVVAGDTLNVTYTFNLTSS